jgi:hypothetical protein
MLAQCHQLLKEDGEIVVSLPNVAHISVRLMLLFGKFQYADRGILDRTHQRFYTRRTARQMIENAGFRIVRQTMTVAPLELVFGFSREGFLFKALNASLAAITRIAPTLFGYQIMLVARSR